MKTFAIGCMVLAATAIVAAKPAKNDVEKISDKQDKVICKSFTQIGSLIATNRICKTKREWESQRASMTVGNAFGSCASSGGEGGGLCSH